MPGDTERIKEVGASRAREKRSIKDFEAHQRILYGQCDKEARKKLGSAEMCQGIRDDYKMWHNGEIELPSYAFDVKHFESVVIAAQNKLGITAENAHLPPHIQPAGREVTSPGSTVRDVGDSVPKFIQEYGSQNPDGSSRDTPLLSYDLTALFMERQKTAKGWVLTNPSKVTFGERPAPEDPSQSSPG